MIFFCYSILFSFPCCNEFNLMGVSWNRSVKQHCSLIQSRRHSWSRLSWHLWYSWPLLCLHNHKRKQGSICHLIINKLGLSFHSHIHRCRHSHLQRCWGRQGWLWELCRYQIPKLCHSFCWSRAPSFGRRSPSHTRCRHISLQRYYPPRYYSIVDIRWFDNQRLHKARSSWLRSNKRQQANYIFSFDGWCLEASLLNSLSVAWLHREEKSEIERVSIKDEIRALETLELARTRTKDLLTGLIWLILSALIF